MQPPGRACPRPAVGTAPGDAHPAVWLWWGRSPGRTAAGWAALHGRAAAGAGGCSGAAAVPCGCSTGIGWPHGYALQATAGTGWVPTGHKGDRRAPGSGAAGWHLPMVRLGMLARIRREAEEYPGCCSPCPGSGQAVASMSGVAWQAKGSGRGRAEHRAVRARAHMALVPAPLLPCSGTKARHLPRCVLLLAHPLLQGQSPCPQGQVCRAACTGEWSAGSCTSFGRSRSRHKHCPCPTLTVAMRLYLCSYSASPAPDLPPSSCSAPG